MLTKFCRKTPLFFGYALAPDSSSAKVENAIKFGEHIKYHHKGRPV